MNFPDKRAQIQPFQSNGCVRCKRAMRPGLSQAGEKPVRVNFCHVDV